jgi:HEAT repeat protein
VADRSIEPEVARRREAALAGHTGDPAAARRLLHDPDPGVRATALGALRRLDRAGPDDLVSGLRDPDPGVRRRACELSVTATGATATAESAPVAPAVARALARLLDDPEPTVVEAAAWACGELGPGGTGMVDRLAELATGHDDALCREAAVAALGAIGDPAGLPAVLRATGDRATVRRRAVLALAPFDGPEVDRALERARTDRDRQVRQAAEDLLTP